MYKTNKMGFWIITILILATAISRLFLINIPNAAPIAAMALFGGAYFMDKKWAFIVTLGALLISDIILQITFSLGIQPYEGFYSLQPVIYLSFILIVMLGILIRENRRFGPIAGAALSSAILFFLITNFAVWAFSNYYAKDWAGLLLCYELALPFFKNTLISNLLFTGVLFGGFELMKARIPALSKAT